MRTAKLIGTRPTHTPTGEEIPGHWLICNAPRPLDGDLAWEDDPFRGNLYVAIDPDGVDAERFLCLNAELHGVIPFWSRPDGRWPACSPATCPG